MTAKRGVRGQLHMVIISRGGNTSGKLHRLQQEQGPISRKPTHRSTHTQTQAGQITSGTISQGL